MRLNPKMCPCGCSKVILEPLCGCQCSSVRPEVAHELATKINAHDDLVRCLLELLADSPYAALAARALLSQLKTDLAAEPKFDRY